VGFHSHAFTAHVVTWIAIAGLAVWSKRSKGVR
jgi:hypothetical protein